MMAGRRGYRDIASFSNDNEMKETYFGLIARGKRFFVSSFHNVDDGQSVIKEITADEAKQCQADWESMGWCEVFIDRWIINTGMV